MDVLVELAHVCSSDRCQVDDQDGARDAAVFCQLAEDDFTHFGDQVTPNPFPLPLRTSAVLECSRVAWLETSHFRPSRAACIATCLPSALNSPRTGHLSAP